MHMRCRGLLGAVIALMLSGAVSPVHGDVWRDCAALWMGGNDIDSDGVFDDGELVDIRHAAIVDASTHGGTLRTGNGGVFHRSETVISATSGLTFSDQRVVYLSQADGVKSDGAPGVKEDDLKLPVYVATNEYTTLLRFRMDETQPSNREFVAVLDLGYVGGGSAAERSSFYVRYYPKTERFALLCNNGSTCHEFGSPTNDVCRTLRGTWVEMAASMSNGTMRLGVKAPGMSGFAWNSASFPVQGGSQIPLNGAIYVGCPNGWGGVSSGTFPVRGSFQLMAYWDRVLTTAEVEEAFGAAGLLESSRCFPSVLTVGSRDYGADVFTGSTTGAVTEVSVDMQDVASFPSGVEAGRTIAIPFKVHDTCTNLPQLVRIVAASDSAAGTIAAKIDGTDLRPMRLAAGTEATRFVSSAMLAEGMHKLTLTRTDEGDGLMSFSLIEISGSWRVGWEDGRADDMGVDVNYIHGTIPYHVTELSSNRWKTVRSSVTTSRTLTLYADVSVADAASRRFTVKSRPVDFPAQSYDLVLCVNGVERFRRLCSPDFPEMRSAPIAVELSPGVLQAGKNEFLWKTELNAAYPSTTQTWLKLDCFTLEVGKDPLGMCVLVR